MIRGLLNVGEDVVSGGDTLPATSACLGGASESGATTGLQIVSGGSTHVILRGKSRSTAVDTRRRIVIQDLLAGTNFGGSDLPTAADGWVYRFYDIGDFSFPTGDTFMFRTTPRTTVNTSSAGAAVTLHGFDLRLAATRSAGTQNLKNLSARFGATGGQYNRSIRVDNGVLRWDSASLTLSNGANDDVGALTSSFTLVVGPTAAFSVTSIRGGATAADPPENGDLAILYNTTVQNMTVTNESGGGTAANRIHTSTGADLTTVGEGVVWLVYDSTLARWRDVSFFP